MACMANYYVLHLSGDGVKTESGKKKKIRKRLCRNTLMLKKYLVFGQYLNDE